MSNLIVLTNKYPYGFGEPFIEAERNYWTLFDNVFICPVLASKRDKIRVNFECRENEVLVQNIDEKSDIDKLTGFYGTLTTVSLIREFIKSKGDIRLALGMGLYTNIRTKHVLEFLKRKGLKQDASDTLIYAYWMYEPALVGLGLKKHLVQARFITRTHRYDLYEERQPNCYIPFRKLVLDSVDAIYPISSNGREYLSQRYHGHYDSKISVERLGTVKLFEGTRREENKEMVIVSCSNMISLKRIDRIIEALKLFKDECEWYHFGNGELMQPLKELAKSLPLNVKAHFMGFVINQDVQKFYSEHLVDAFINVSESEGVPVSIMEAQSYGIPVVATDVGGTSELVHNGVNGVLVKNAFNNEELYKGICCAIRNKAKFETAALLTWDKLSNADKNYRCFFEKQLEFMRHNK